MSLNPALSELVTAGRLPIPAGYQLRLPEAGAAGFESRLAGVAPEPRVVQAATRTVLRKGRAQTRPAVLTVRVRRGQTLSHIALEHRVSVASLRRVNRLAKASLLRPGQTLRIPLPANAT